MGELTVLEIMLFGLFVAVVLIGGTLWAIPEAQRAAYPRRVQAAMNGTEMVIKLGALGLLAALSIGMVKSCASGSDGDRCSALYGGSYTPEYVGSTVYCENHFTGDREYLRG